VWRTDFTTDVWSLHVSGDTLYTGGDELVALDATDGSVRWRREGDHAFEEIVPAGGTLYVRNDTDVLALDPASGRERWRFAPPDRNREVVDYAVSGDTVYARLASDVLYALDADTGERRYVLAPGGRLSPVAAAGGTGYVAKNGTVLSLDGED